MLSDENESWRIIPGFHNKYEVSNLGRIRKFTTKRIMKTSPHIRGYLYATMRLDGKKVMRLYHRLVATAFIPNPENKTTVNHKNGIKTDNRVENLEWVSLSENIQHSFRNLGRENIHCSGKNNHRSRGVKSLKDGKIFDTITEAARFYKISTTSIHASCTNKIKNKKFEYYE